MNHLRIYLPESLPAADSVLDWAELAEGGQLRRQGSAVLTDLPADLPLEGVAPAASVLLTQVRLPVQQGEKARRLLPSALEEQLACDMEQVHAVLGSPLPDGQVSVAVVDRHWLRAWCQALAQAGRPLRHLHPETLLLPWQSGTCSLVWHGEQGLLRSGTQAGLALGNAALAPLQLGTLPAHVMLYADAVPAWLRPLAPHINLKGHWHWQQAAAAAPLDLLQGEFALRHPLLHGQWSRYRWAAGLLALALLLQLGGTAGQVWRMQREQQALQQQMLQSFRQAFPDSTVVVDPLLQMARQLADLRRAAGQADPHDFLPLLQAAQPALQGGQAQKMTFENQTLQIEYPAPETAAIAALQQRLASSGLRSETSTTDGVLRVKVWRP